MWPGQNNPRAMEEVEKPEKLERIRAQDYRMKTVGNGQMSLTSEVKTNNTIELKDLIQPHNTNIVN